LKKLFSMLTVSLFFFCFIGTGWSASDKVGVEVLELHEIASPYETTGIVWQQTFTQKDAGYVSIHFADFALAPGDYVEVSSPDGEYNYRYDGDGKIVRGGAATISTFWAKHIPSDTAIVTFHHTSAENAGGFSIDKWAHGHMPAMSEAICGSDDKDWAPCYSGTTKYEKSKTVVRLLINGTSACTGWLVGSEGHVMTNNHCISTQTSADNTDYEFMAEGASCSTSCNGWFGCPGVVEENSGTLVKTNSALDYALILLPNNHTATYGFLQLRGTMPTLGESIYIPQHPGAKGKQIASFDSQSGGDCKVDSVSTSPCTGGPGDIGYNCDTEGGSSGSPVIASGDNLVIALHHCARCLNRGVPITAVITSLGTSLPNDAIGGASSPVSAVLQTNMGMFTTGDTLNIGTKVSNTGNTVRVNAFLEADLPDGSTILLDSWPLFDVLGGSSNTVYHLYNHTFSSSDGNGTYKLRLTVKKDSDNSVLSVSEKTFTFSSSSSCGFSEDFNDNAANNWVDDSSGLWSIAGGEYVMSGSSAGVWRFSEYNDPSFSDFTYEVTLKRTAGPGTSKGVIFRNNNYFASNGDGYGFWITSTGEYSVWKHVGGISTPLVTWVSSSAINTGLGASNTIKVVANGSSLSFFANGLLLRAITDSSFSSGKVGVGVYSSSLDVVRFDDISLTCGTSSSTQASVAADEGPSTATREDHS